MRAGPKKALSLLRWGAPGVPGPYTVERPQDREDYQDGDISLSRLWEDRPYSDVEEPHPNADTDLDAEQPGKPARRLNMEQVVRRAVMELVADEQEDLERERGEYLDQSGAFSGPLWSKVAPLVNCVLDLMRMLQDGDQLRSKLESSSIRKKEFILAVAKKAEVFGFGYRTKKKDWNNFQELVPAVTGMLKDEHNRELLGNALAEWVGEEGPIDPRDFAGAPPNRDDWGFKVLAPSAGAGRDTQEYYKGYVPGAVPRQETYNVERLVALARGKVGSKMVSGLRDRLRDRRIIDFETAEVNTKRLQSLLRYVVDQPDSQLAMSIVVAAIVREILRHVHAAGEEAVRFDGGKVRLSIRTDQLLSGMQGGTKRVVDEWLNIAVSMMSVVGVLPSGEPPPGDEDAEYFRADMPKYKAIQNRMRAGLASIGLEIATEAIQGMRDRQRGVPRGEDEDEGESWTELDIEALHREFTEGARAVRQAVAAPARELARRRDIDQAGMTKLDEVLERFDDAMGDRDAVAASAAGEELHRIMSSLGASSASLSGAERAISELRRLAAQEAELADKKSASVTVADIAKRIVAPAKMRIVPRDEAEEGVDLGDGETLELPGKRHAARRAIGGSVWVSR